MPIKPGSKTTKQSSGAEEQQEVTAKPKKSNGNFNKIVMICVSIGAAIFVVMLIVYFARTAGGSPEETVAGGETNSPQAQEEVVVDEAKPWLSGDGGSETVETVPEEVANEPKLTEPDTTIKPGITDPSKDRYVKNYSPVEKDTFVSDLNGKKVKENFEIASIETITDFISYTKKRAVTADGIELYWLDAKYKGKKAKVQVPFKIFKELDPVGVTVVDVEVVKVANEDISLPPSEIVTGFTVRSDYKELLQQASNGY